MEDLSKIINNKPEKEFQQVLDMLQKEHGWDWTTIPDERKITAEIINDTIKVFKKLCVNKLDECVDYNKGLTGSILGGIKLISLSEAKTKIQE